MTKVALCVKDINDFNRISDGEIETIEVEFVDREICEKVDGGYVQIIPYVSFSYLDQDAGRLNMVSYRRPSTGEGEERLQGNASFGFGGHIDSVDDLHFTSSEKREDGGVVYRMTVDDIKRTAMQCATRELVEELGFDPIEALEIPIQAIHFGLEREQDPDEVGRVHLCISMMVSMDQKRYVDFFEKAKDANKEEIEELTSVAVDVGRFLGSFNVKEAMQHLTAQLEAELKLEKWSVLVITFMLTQMVEFFQSNWDFPSIMAQMMQRRQEQLTQQAAEDAKEDTDTPSLEADSAKEVTVTLDAKDTDPICTVEAIQQFVQDQQTQATQA